MVLFELFHLQVAEFRKLYVTDSTGDHLVDNFRPLQQLHERHVTTNFKPSENSATALAPLYALVAFSIGLKVWV